MVKQLTKQHGGASPHTQEIDTMKITLTNAFHQTAITLNLRSEFLSDGQLRKAKSALCPSKGCSCSGSAGYHGKQTAPIVDHSHTQEVFTGLELKYRSVPRFSI